MTPTIEARELMREMGVALDGLLSFNRSSSEPLISLCVHISEADKLRDQARQIEYQDSEIKNARSVLAKYRQFEEGEGTR